MLLRKSGKCFSVMKTELEVLVLTASITSSLLIPSSSSTLSNTSRILSWTKYVYHIKYVIMEFRNSGYSYGQYVYLCIQYIINGMSYIFMYSPIISKLPSYTFVHIPLSNHMPTKYISGSYNGYL